MDYLTRGGVTPGCALLPSIIINIAATFFLAPDKVDRRYL